MYLQFTDYTINSPTTNCSDQVNLQLGDNLTLVSPCSCSDGQFIIDHLDNKTSQYNVINNNGSHRATIMVDTLDDGGIYRFRCNNLSSVCCYYTINGNYFSMLYIYWWVASLCSVTKLSRTGCQWSYYWSKL